MWSLCPGAVALSTHVTVDESAWAEVAGVQTALKTMIRERFHIEHTTIQLECRRCAQGVVACVNHEL